MTQPSIAVVIPVFNGANYLREALNSVLAQTVPVTEIIVVDDGSTDPTAEIAAAYPGVRVIRQPNRGCAAALNAGVAITECALLAFLDHDDLWPTNKIASQLDCLAAPDPPAMVLGFMQNFHSPEIPDATRQTILCPPEPVAGFTMGSLMLQRDVFNQIGPLRTDWKIGTHVEWFARAHDMGLRSTMLPDIMLYRRLHTDNISRREMASRPDFARMLKVVLDRRRAQQSSTDSP